MVKYVYLLNVWTPYDGNENLGIYSTRELAEVQAEQYRKTASYRHENVDIDTIEIDAPAEFDTD